MPGMMGERGPEGPPGTGAARWIGTDGGAVDGATVVASSLLGGAEGEVVYLDASGAAWSLDPATCDVAPIMSSILLFEATDCTGAPFTNMIGVDRIAVAVSAGVFHVVSGAPEMRISGSRLLPDGSCVGSTGELTPMRALGSQVEAPAVACAPPLHLER